MKLEIELSKEQLQLLINAIEINFRFLMKQESIVTDLLAVSAVPLKSGKTDKEWEREFDDWLIRSKFAEKNIRVACETLYKEYMGQDAHRLSDMWSALRHLQYEQDEEKHDWDVRSCEPMQLSDYPMISVKEIKQ